MRRLLVVPTAAVLALALAGGSAAQEEPAPASEALDGATTAQPLPVADWSEWDMHRQAARHRMHGAAVNADNAKAKKAGFYQSLVGVYDDERRWLSNHTPDACYAAEFEAWSAAVDELHAAGTDAAALAKKGNKRGLKKAVKQRDAAWASLESLAFTSPAESCAFGEPGALPPTLAGKWQAKPVYVEDGGLVDKRTRKLTIGDDGMLTIQVAGHPVCRDGTRGPVSLIVTGSGEVITEGRPGFSWLTERVDCKRKGKGQRLAGPGQEPSFLAYDPVADVLLQDGNAECYWRVDGGSKQDCQLFWQGTAPPPAEYAAPAEVDEPTDADAAAA
jgi:hypothetical protein